MCDVPLNSKPLSDFQLVGADVSEAFVIAITVPNDPDAEHSNLIMISVSGEPVQSVFLFDLTRTVC